MSGQQLAETQPQRQRAEIAALTTYWISTELRASSRQTAPKTID
jgi:hypothetical protein